MTITFPKGVIAMWSESEIPDGWVACEKDGNDAPNLKDRFVLGADAQYPVNTRGGGEHFHDFKFKGEFSCGTRTADKGTEMSNLDGTRKYYFHFSGKTTDQYPLLPEFYALHFIMKVNDSHNIPKGLIVMWSGAPNTIPRNGWSLCNGQNGTPNLEERFIRCQGDENRVNTAGGSKQHSHKIQDDKKIQIDALVYTKGNKWPVFNTDNVSPHTSFTIKSKEEDSKPPFMALCYIIKD